MGRLVVLLALAASVLAACRGIPTPSQDVPADPTASHTIQPPRTATPTPLGTWEMVIHGLVYDRATGSPIARASIAYKVIHSYFPEIQEGRPNATVSDEQGRFSLPMIVHDTDNIRIVVEAPGYRLYEEKLDLFGDRTLDIELTHP